MSSRRSRPGWRGSRASPRSATRSPRSPFTQSGLSSTTTPRDNDQKYKTNDRFSSSSSSSDDDDERYGAGASFRLDHVPTPSSSSRSKNNLTQSSEKKKIHFSPRNDDAAAATTPRLLRSQTYRTPRSAVSDDSSSYYTPQSIPKARRPPTRSPTSHTLSRSGESTMNYF